MGLFQLIPQAVNDLLQGLNLGCQIQIIAYKGCERQVENFADGADQDVQFLAAAGSKGHFLLLHLNRRLENVHGVVADALKVTDGVQQLGDLGAVGYRQTVGGQMDEIGADMVLVLVHLISSPARMALASSSVQPSSVLRALRRVSTAILAMLLAMVLDC